MKPLRNKMIQALSLRGFSPRTHQSYLAAVTDLAKYYHRSPDQLGMTELKAYFEHLAIKRQLSGATCRLFLKGLR